MTDRTDISQIGIWIAEWYHNQKAKKRKDEITTCEQYIKKDYEFSNEQYELLDSDIIIEQHMKVDSLKPLRISEDYSQLTIRRPDGHKCIIHRFDENGKAPLNERIIKTIARLETFTEIDNCCSNCQYEIYEKYAVDKEWVGKEIEYNRRDCMNLKEEAQRFFRSNVRIQVSKGEIEPAINCPWWHSRNGQTKEESGQ